MRVDVHTDSILRVPASFDGASTVKIWDQAGNIIALAIEHGGAIVVMKADDPDFVSFCDQYNIQATAAEKVT